MIEFDRRAIPADAVESRWRAPDGYAIRRIDWLPPAGSPGGFVGGSLLFVPGRGDTYEKYLEALDHWSRGGWRVTASDWRGQALSGRLGLDEHTGHVDDFAIWVEDLAALWALWKASTLGPHVLVAHSMGGHLALRAVEERGVDPDALVLSAPMLGFNPGWVPTSLMHGLARLMSRLGDPRRPAWKWSEKPGAGPLDRSTLLTHDALRYDDEAWWRSERPGLGMGPASWGWLRAALASIRGLRRPGVLERIMTPILILATTADRLVDYGAIRTAARRLPRAQLVTFGEEARHEILREEDTVRDKALGQVDEFLGRVLAMEA
ncbi:MAG TPA: alpha/beta hydrolase [Novosphingobium sp.]|nr:alpha/beta hydrolase [Novosphingobium sp.]